MATVLINNITEFKAAGLGGWINNDANVFASLSPFLVRSDKDYIQPWVGYTLFNRILNLGGSPTAEETALKTLLQRASGAFCLYRYLRGADARVGEKGRERNETSAFRYQEIKQDTELLTIAYAELEDAIVYINDNPTAFPEWATTEGYKRHRALFLNKSQDFRWLYGRDVTRYVYEYLRPLIEQIEKGVIKKYLPKQLYNQLMTARNANTLTAKQTEVLDYIKTAVAHWTMSHALQKGFVQFDNTGVKITQLNDKDDSKTPIAVDPATMAYSITWNDLWADTHMNDLKNYLIENKTDFPLAFATANGGTNADADAWDFRTELEKDPNADVVLPSERKIVMI